MAAAWESAPLVTDAAPAWQSAPLVESTPAYTDVSGEFGPPTGGEKGYSSVKEALAPAPNTTYGDVLPIARDDKTGALRPALPGMIRNPLIGLTQEGPQITGGKLQVPGATIDPNTNTLGITPQAASVVPFAATPLRFGPQGPVPAGLAAREAPLSAEFRQNPLLAEAPARIEETARVSAAPPPPPPGTTRFYHGGDERGGGGGRWVTPDQKYAAGYASKAEGSRVSYVDIPNDHPALEANFDEGTGRYAHFNAPPEIAAQLKPLGGPAPSSPTGIPSMTVRPQPEPAAPVRAAPTTRSAAADDIASAYYKTFDKAAQEDGSLTSAVTNNLVKRVEDAAPPAGMGGAFSGKNHPLTEMAERWQEYKDKPMSLEEAHLIDKDISRNIQKYQITDPNTARLLRDIQGDFRAQLDNPAPGDVVGGQAGLQALAPARKAYAQARRMEEVESVLNMAETADNKQTAIKSGIQALLKQNEKRPKGYNNVELAAMKYAASRGVVGGLLHVFGSRLIPSGAFIAGGFGGGVLGAVAAGLGTHVGTAGIRSLGGALQTGRANKLLSTLGKSVPPAPRPRP